MPCCSSLGPHRVSSSPQGHHFEPKSETQSLLLRALGAKSALKDTLGDSQGLHFERPGLQKRPQGYILRVLGFKRALKVILMAPFGLPWSLVGLFLSQQAHKPTETHITSRSQQNQQHHYKKSAPTAQAAPASPAEAISNNRSHQKSAEPASKNSR